MNIAKTIAAKANNQTEAFNLAVARKHDLEQDWENEATIYTFPDKSVLVLSGPTWYAKTKTAIKNK